MPRFRTPHRRAASAAAAVATALLTIAACGDDGESADPVDAGPSELAGAEISPTYECTAGDPASQALVGMLAEGEELSFEPRVAVGPVSPVPAPGETFTATFTGAVALDPDLVDTVMALGIREASITDVSLTVSPGAGAEGDDLVAEPPGEAFTLVEGEGVQLDVGPFDLRATRTSSAGEPVSFEVGTLSFGVATRFAGADVQVNMSCVPTEDRVLTLEER